MKRLYCLLMIGLMAAACAPTTPQARIEKNPALFAALKPKDQALVQRGELAKGMNEDAVLLAWGPPSMRYTGYYNNKSSERWDYTGTDPVYTGHYFGAYGFAGCGHYRRPYGYYGVGPEVTYIPYRRASVWFVNDRVDSWERVR